MCNNEDGVAMLLQRCYTHSLYMALKMCMWLLAGGCVLAAPRGGEEVVDQVR